MSTSITRSTSSPSVAATASKTTSSCESTTNENSPLVINGAFRTGLENQENLSDSLRNRTINSIPSTSESTSSPSCGETSEAQPASPVLTPQQLMWVKIQTIFQKWNVDFSLSTKVKPITFRIFCTLMIGLDKHFATLKHDDEKAVEIKTYVVSLLEALPRQDPKCSEEFILAELGLIYFYFDKCGFPPRTNDFHSYRLNEIQNDIRRFRQNEVKPLPTGESSYMLRALCEMAIDTKGVLNFGGILSILRLLKRGLSIHLNPGHATHVSHIFQELLKNGELAGVLQRPVQLHPTMAFVVRLDVKLPSAAPITRQHLRMECLMALLHNLRQVNRPNCATVATVIYTNKVFPVASLKKYQEFQEKGTFTLDGVTIPVPPLLFMRLINDDELETILSWNQLNSSEVLKMTLKLLNVDIASLGLENKAYSIKDFLKEVTKAKPDPNVAYHMAVCYLSSFRTNALVEGSVGAIEFGEINSSQRLWHISEEKEESSRAGSEADTSEYEFRAVKKNLINFIKCEILRKTQAAGLNFFAQSVVKEIMDEFYKSLQIFLWLQNNSGKLEIKGEDVHLKLSAAFSTTFPQLARKLEGDHLDKLKWLVENHRQIVWLSPSKEIKVIYKISDFRLYLVKLFNTICEERAARMSIHDRVASFMLRGFMDVLLATELPGFIETLNLKAPLTEKEYKSSELMIFPDDGGFCFDYPLQALGIPHTLAIMDQENPILPFFALFDYLYHLPNKTRFLKPDGHLLCRSKNHAFTLQPFKFSALWNEHEYTQEVQEKGEAPMLRLLENPLTEEQKLAILREVFRDREARMAFLNGLKTEEKENREILWGQIIEAEKGADFMRLFLKSTEEIWHDDFFFALGEEVIQIKSEEMPWDTLLTQLFPTLDTQLAATLKTDLIRNFDPSFLLRTFQRATLSPHTAAFVIQWVLNHHRVFVSKDLLENTLCSLLGLPFSWTLGDLNYGGNEEIPEDFLIKLRILPNLKVTLYASQGHKETPLPDNLVNAMHRLSIVHSA